jgi:hypothetical protein
LVYPSKSCHEEWILGSSFILRSLVTKNGFVVRPLGRLSLVGRMILHPLFNPQTRRGRRLSLVLHWRIAVHACQWPEVPRVFPARASGSPKQATGPSGPNQTSTSQVRQPVEPRHRSTGTARHDQEPPSLPVAVLETPEGQRHQPSGPRRRSVGPRRRSTGPRHRSTGPRHRSTGPRRRSTEPRHRSTEPRRRSTGFLGRSKD